MSTRRTVAVVAGLLLAGAAAYWWLRPAGPVVSSGAPAESGSPVGNLPPSASNAPTSAAPAGPVAGTSAAPLTPVGPAGPVAAPIERSHLADQLNAPDRTIEQDLNLIHEIFGTWRTNFPSEGNPIGTNVEITAALTGKNRHQFAFIPADHPAVNGNGELCDRWGTPFFFHQLSGSRMEIDSAGPDKKHHTADDVRFLPEMPDAGSR